MRDLFSTFKPTFYIRLSSEQLTIRDAKTKKTISELPEIAIHTESQPTIVAIGQDARAPNLPPSVTVLKPFSHPRSIVSDFTIGEQLLKVLIKRMHGRSLFSPSPRIIVHVPSDPAGGYTQIEIRALQEMAIGAGASHVTIWQGRTLADDELLSGRFPSDGQVLA